MTYDVTAGTDTVTINGGAGIDTLTISKNQQDLKGFHNYLLDQTAVQDNYRNTHSTE